MSYLNIGYFFVVMGAAFLIGGGGIPPYGFQKGYKLFQEYKTVKASLGTPSLDQKGAYCTYMCYKIGGFCILSGVILIVMYLLLGE